MMRSRNLLLHVIISRRRLASATDRSVCPSIAVIEFFYLINVAIDFIIHVCIYAGDIESHPLTVISLDESLHVCII